MICNTPEISTWNIDDVVDSWKVQFNPLIWKQVAKQKVTKSIFMYTQIKTKNAFFYFIFLQYKIC